MNHCLDASDYYRFNLTEGQSIDIETYLERSSDTVVRLYSSGEELLVQNDDRANNEFASLIEGFIAPLTNTYRLLVSQYNQRIGPERPYKLLVRDACPSDIYEHDDHAIEARILDLDAALEQEQATLCDEDWRRVRLEAGQWLDLQLSVEDLALDRGIELIVSREFGRQVLRNYNVTNLDSRNFSFEAPLSADYWFLLRPDTQYYGGELKYTFDVSSREFDRCDGQDNDQDGLVDENVLNACGTCGEVPIESCNGEDDDCDGRSDEGTLNACGLCGELPEETCNGEDDDCDGINDEGVLNACGLCGEVPEELCNGIDDDCDGMMDEKSQMPVARVEKHQKNSVMGKMMTAMEKLTRDKLMLVENVV